MKPLDKYRVIGVMSGTSLDGLDIACCDYQLRNDRWVFEILFCATVKYSSNWIAKLSNAHNLSGQELSQLDVEYGSFIGKKCKDFISKKKIRKVNLISSHGHTIFHQPRAGLTYQLGNGNAIYATTGIPVVFDFRSLDVARGGEGAPLVPIGDALLFSQYEACINLGGIANISFLKKGKRIAFDVCFANMGLNYLASNMNKAYDKNGAKAALGQVDSKFLKKLSALYLKWEKDRPSLGREGFEKYLISYLDNDSISLQDRMRTLCESICLEVVKSLPAKQDLKILVTGGGALNTFLVKRLSEMTGKNQQVIVPDKQIVDFKEALVFGFLGVRKVRGEVNVLSTVTGARQDSIAGTTVGI